MLAAARNIGRLMTDYKVVVDKSTVPVGAGDLVKAAIAEELKKNRGVQTPHSVMSNPEFLEEGAAVEALDGADALAIVPEWKEFRSSDLDVIKQKLKTSLVFDGRKLYDPQFVRAQEIEYLSVGR